MAYKIYTAIFICVAVCGFILWALNVGDFNRSFAEILTQGPNELNPLALKPEPKNEPRKIVLPQGKKLTTKYKCPAHGVVELTLTLELETTKHVYCKRCALKFMVDVFELNLPKLEVVK